MPRQLASTKFTAASTGLGATAAAFLLVCAFVLAGCAWRKFAMFRWRRGRDPVISIQQVQGPAGPGFGGEVCIWQRGILMGEKCQLPVFSGVIAYDTAGNLLLPGRPRFVDSAKVQRQGAVS